MSAVYVRSRDVLWRNAGNRLVVRSLKRESLVSLEGSATMLWSFLARPISLDDLVAAMAAHYAVDVDTVSDAVAQAVEDLEHAGLVTTAEPDCPHGPTSAPAAAHRSAAAGEAVQ